MSNAVKEYEAFNKALYECKKQNERVCCTSIEELLDCFDVSKSQNEVNRQNQTIIERIGVPAFLEQIAEECAELAQAALKTARKYRGENPTPKTIDECLDSLQEEMADVMLCMDEWFDYREKDFLAGVCMTKQEKLERWKQRLEEVGK